MNALRDTAAIVGIGETDYTKNSGRTELGLAVEAISGNYTPPLQPERNRRS